MSARSRRRSLRRSDAGVSEVIGYVLGFFMAFLILVSTLYAFGEVNASARRLSAQAEVRDVANRVALGVQEGFGLASTRNDTQNSIESNLLRFNRTLTVPDTIQGWPYRVSLDPNFVNGTVIGPAVNVSVPTFNAAVSLPPSPASCSVNYVVCALSGTVEGAQGRIVISYHFNRTASPVVSEITLG